MRLNSIVYIKGLLVANLLSMQVATANTIPSWVLQPNVKGGLAAVDCVEFSGNLSVDAKLASSNARLALSKQINTQIEGVDETYDAREASNGESQLKSRFSSSSTQTTKQSISGSKIVKSDVVNIQGKNYFCSMAILTEDKTKDLFENLVNDAGVQLTSQSKKALYKEFSEQEAPKQADQIESLIDES